MRLPINDGSPCGEIKPEHAMNRLRRTVSSCHLPRGSVDFAYRGTLARLGRPAIQVNDRGE